MGNHVLNFQCNLPKNFLSTFRKKITEKNTRENHFAINKLAIVTSQCEVHFNGFDKFELKVKSFHTINDYELQTVRYF